MKFLQKIIPKFNATFSSNLLTRSRANSESTDSFSSWIYSNTSCLACDFEISLKDFRSPSLVDLNAATMFYQCLIVVLALVDSCVVRRYKTSQISQRVTHVFFSTLKTWLGLPFYMWRSLDKDLNVSAIFYRSSLILDQSKKVELHFLFCNQLNFKTWNNLI